MDKEEKEIFWEKENGAIRGREEERRRMGWFSEILKDKKNQRKERWERISSNTTW